ncbi:ATP-grasp domain-containing protein [Nocardioides marmoriginsengisoli]|uniref:biotin carboxylase n=1 Tax=Nocardioides marmoriginsengisoli TaxID=661483 RepID=A0A3N0CF12_9ACTN|nr:biotin carboxylase N-terminal domain-containing protein [Nocardioides marmoriginsengisoli]RNL62035.1 ATP-grasp domain-containing protein [Nocardioides marmoriginsengisoli]
MTRPTGRPFGTLLVANRGEIAIRVMKTARAMGLRTVAVYSEGDRQAPHVRYADAAVLIGPTPATESYLSIPAILKAAADTGAEAIHPGYGFLSERAEFARAVVDAGLVFVGPAAEVMDRMGRKDHAREIAIAAGVPVVPSYAAVSEIAAGDFPVLVKAAAGGGGKGMRVVRAADELDDAIAAAKREAASAFGDDTLLIEKYVERGRHVEVQVMGDDQGNVIHLYERDCSTQRRHQKVLEEAPAPTLSADLRRLLTESSVALSEQVGYVNAGTVEFLVDATPGVDAAYFLEMNTRLQVEHPVTEAITGLDLVELQLRVAMGKPLSLTQDDVTVTGHAIEARVYAEDAFGGFLPQAGTAEMVRWSDRSRNDVALEPRQVVSSSYDPMLGKVIVHGPDREAARKLLIGALDGTAILGLTTNVGFLRGLAASPAFRDCAIDTAWLDRHPDEIAPVGSKVAAIFAAWAIADDEIGQQPGNPFGTADGWRLAGPAAPATILLVVDGEETRWSVSWKRIVGPYGESSTRLIAREPDRLRIEIDGRIREAAVRVGPRSVDVVVLGNAFTFDRPDPFAPGAASQDSSGAVLAPMPGTVLAIDVAVGDRVEEGQRLGVIEAMKMELALKAPFAGTVVQVGAAVGGQVDLKQQLFEVTASDVEVTASDAGGTASDVEPVETRRP